MGKAGSGKSTVAAMLEELVGYETRSFAAPLKDVAAEIWGDTARTDRSKLQPLGVAVRDIDEDAWVNLLLRRLEESSSDAPCAVDDLRFPNEYWGLKSANFVIVEVRADRDTRIGRLKANGKWQGEDQLEHISETALDNEGVYRSDFVIGNFDTKGTLAESVVNLLNRIRRSREAW